MRKREMSAFGIVAGDEVLGTMGIRGVVYIFEREKGGRLCARGW